MRGTAIALAFAFFASGCDTGTAASPVFESTPATAEGGGAEAGFAVCPPDIDASFGSIYAQMLSTSSCGSTSNKCHSTTAAMNINGLDYSLDAGAVYAELLGDGGGVQAFNIADPSNKVLRVVPFDAGASMLYIKLTTKSSMSPYGSGMPFGTPGSVCPATVEAVGAWINGGAPFEPPEGGPGTDAAGDAAADAGPSADATLD